MTRRAASLCGALLLVGGCGGGSGTSDTAGQKLVSGRDLSEPFFWDGQTLGYVRAAADTSQPEPQDLWIHDLAAGASSVALTGIDWAPPSSWPRSRAGSLLITGTTGRRFYDFGSRVDTDLADFGLVGIGGRPSEGLFEITFQGNPVSFYPISVIRRDAGAIALAGGNGGALGVGWPNALRTLILPGSIAEVTFLGLDLAVLYAPYTDGVNQQAGIYKVTLPSGDLTPLVPPRPIADWTGVAGSCTVGGRCLFKVVGCSPSDPVCPGQDKPPCLIFYGTNSHDAAGTMVPHAYDVDAGTDVELPGAVTRFTVSGDQHRVLWDDGNALKVNYWDLCTDTRLQCADVPVGPVVWRPDGKGFAAIDTAAYSFGVASLVDGACVGRSYPVAVYGVQFSPAGDRLLWLGNSVDESQPQAWLAAADGSDPVKIADGEIFGTGWAGDGRRIFIGRGGSSNAGLSWLDPDVYPPVEHLLADNYGGFSAVGSERVLLIDHWNSQDGNGELTLIDIDSGARQRLARAVTDMTTAGDIDGQGTNVAYTIRTRVSSDRDGLWLTTLP